MPTIFRRLLGFILLLATVGLTTCQSMVKAEPGQAIVERAPESNK